MAETGSRYSIMEELNNRKIREKEALAELERETDNAVFETEQRIDKAERVVKEKTSSYKSDYRKWKRQKEVERDMVQNKYERELNDLNKELADREENYEKEFLEWKAREEEGIQKTNDNVERYKKEQADKVKAKTEIIAEIEKGINDLKEMSSEQGKGE